MSIDSEWRTISGCDHRDRNLEAYATFQSRDL